MNVRRIAIVATIALVALLGLGIYKAGLDETPPPPLSTDIIFHEGIAHGERIKTRSWSADYDRLVSNADQTVLDLDNVRNGVIYKNGKPYLHVRASHMTVNSRCRTASLCAMRFALRSSGRPLRRPRRACPR